MSPPTPRIADAEHPLQSESSPPDGNPPSPRAFVIGTGVCFQFIGACFLFGAAAVWFAVTWFLPNPAPSTGDPIEFFDPGRVIESVLVLTLIATFVGGLMLTATGLGLQAERRESGIVATTASGLMVVGYLLATAFVAFASPSPRFAAVPAVLAGACFILFLLAFRSAALLRRFPPPSDLGRASPEFLEELRRKEADRLRKYDL